MRRVYLDSNILIAHYAVDKSEEPKKALVENALNVFAERDLVDFVTLMAQHSRDDTVLIGFDQHLPPGQKPLLP